METIRRKACRAVLVTAAGEVLLIKIASPVGEWTGWITPGGGIDEGESEIECLARELKEELGFQLSGEPEKLWLRTHKFPWDGKPYEQHEVFFLVRTEKFEPSNQTEHTEIEKRDFRGMQWWKLDEIEKSQENFAPRKLASLLRDVLKNGFPPEPIEISE
jgi:8-oxo-dGTP pyrophosphatase MutT (NUDIX family)